MSAIEGLERLLNAVGDGTIEARLVVDQPYAEAQEEEDTWQHPRGGRAHFLGDGLKERSAELIQVAADHLITSTGSDIQKGMARIAENLSEMVEEDAPRLDEILRYSGHPIVTDNGKAVYNREPKQPRRRDTLT